MTVPGGREVRLATVASIKSHGPYRGCFFLPFFPLFSFFYSFVSKYNGKQEEKFEEKGIKKNSFRLTNRSRSDAVNHMSIRGRSLLRAGKLIAGEVKIQVRFCC